MAAVMSAWATWEGEATTVMEEWATDWSAVMLQHVLSWLRALHLHRIHFQTVIR